MSGVARSIFRSICGRTGRGVTGGAERSPWVTDIHNGISNPLFTYTGGPTIVPDENGILRRTPAGYPAVEGGRWVTTLAEGALLGPELITVEDDRTFSSDTGWWTKGVGWSISSGVAACNSASTTYLYRAGLAANGKFYQITLTVLRTSGDVCVVLGGSLELTAASPWINQSGTYTYTIWTVGSSNSNIVFQAISTGFVGSIDNVSIREVIPQWYPPTAGTTRSISTRKGLRTIQTADTFEGMLIEPAMTNKVTARKSNPTDTTGVTGAGGATVTRVLDTVALTEGGYQGICTTFYDYELSIPQNGTISMAGAVANLNKHSVSLDMRLVSGIGVQLGLTGQTSDVTLTAAFSRQKKENLTPLAITDVITITNLNADTAVVRCILPGLEESAFCTSRIAPAADTAAAQTRAASVVSASTSGVFPSTGQDFAVFQRLCINSPASAAADQSFSLYINSANRSRIYRVSGQIALAVNVGGVNTTALSLLATVGAGDTVELIALKTSGNISIKSRSLGGAWGAWVNLAHTVAIPLPPTYVIGPHEGASYITANYPRTAIIAMPPKATLAEYQTWIEAELTRRGLI